jgi:tetratricopeptide (TPR) repeat protein
MRPVLRRIEPLVFIRIVLVFGLFVAGGMLLPLVLAEGAAFAQAKDEAEAAEEAPAGEAQPQSKRSATLREKVYKKLSEAQARLDKDDYAGAMQIINEVKADPDLNSYERGMVWNYTAQVHIAQDKYPEALKSFEQLLAVPNIPEGLQLGALYATAQLYGATEQHQKAVDTMKKWFKLSKTPTPAAYVQLGTNYYQLEQYKEAAAAGEKGLALAREQKAQPPESVLMLLRGSYFELDNIPKVLEVLELMVNLYPKGQYFHQLSQLYGDRGDEKRQLLTLEAAYDGGYLNTQGQYLTLASLLTMSEVPYKGAKILAEGIDKKIVKDSVDNLRRLAHSWLVAQEPRKAIPVLTRAAKDAEDGELYVSLANSYASLDEWKDCSEAVRAGLKKGKLDRLDSAYVTLGNCLFNMDDLDGAIAAFENARKDERSAKIAFQWSQFLRSEKERRQRIANSLL